MVNEAKTVDVQGQKISVKEAIEDMASHNSYSRSVAYSALQEFSETAQEAFDASDLDKLLSYTQAEADVPQGTRQIAFHTIRDILKAEGFDRIDETTLLPLMLKQLKSYHPGTQLYARDLFAYCAAVTKQPEIYAPHVAEFTDLIVNTDSPGCVLDTIEKQFGQDGAGKEKPYALDLLSIDGKWYTEANLNKIHERDHQKEAKIKDELKKRGLFECPQDGVIVYWDTGLGFDDPESKRHLSIEKFELDDKGEVRRINRDGISLGDSLDDLIAAHERKKQEASQK